MKIYVLTNGVRDIDKSYKQLDYTIYFDVNNLPHKCYLNLLRVAMTSNEDVLILEDDLILCKNFLNRITPIIEQYKDNIINFFWQPLRNVKKTTIEQKGFLLHPMCILPKGNDK